MCARSIFQVQTNSTERAPLIVLFQDDQLIAVDKPAGIPAQPDRTGDRSVFDDVKELVGVDRSASIGGPHRLDRPVSGVMLFTQDAYALRVMNERFRDGAVRKIYLAMVEGRPPEEGRCDHRLMHSAGTRKTRVIEEENEDARDASLSYRTIAVGDRFSLLRVEPEGGAFHQIRSQLAAIGFPIKGDVKYGARRGEPDRSIALHASHMEFAHPVSGAPMVIEAPFPTRGIWPKMQALIDPAKVDR